MITRVLLAIAALSATDGSLFAQQNTPVKVGSHVVVQMTGELAAEYAKRIRAIKDGQTPEGLEISTTALIAQELDDGRIRVEHTSHIVRDCQPVRLVTFTAVVQATKLTVDVVSKGTAIYASPEDPKNGVQPAVTATQTKTLRLKLSKLQGLKLRTWTLSEELGD